MLIKESFIKYLKDTRVGVFLILELRVLKKIGPWKDIENHFMFVLQKSNNNDYYCISENKNFGIDLTTFYLM